MVATARDRVRRARGMRGFSTAGRRARCWCALHSGLCRPRDTPFVAVRVAVEFVGPVPVGEVEVTASVVRAARSAVLVAVTLLSAVERCACRGGSGWSPNATPRTLAAPLAEPVDGAHRTAGSRRRLPLPRHDRVAGDPRFDAHGRAGAGVGPSAAAVGRRRVDARAGAGGADRRFGQRNLGRYSTGTSGRSSTSTSTCICRVRSRVNGFSSTRSPTSARPAARWPARPSRTCTVRSG